MADRERRVLIDWRQNERGRSQIAPYSLRATPWPLVSTPVTWAEVEATAHAQDGRALFFTPAQALARVREFGDLFALVLRRSEVVPTESR